MKRQASRCDKSLHFLKGGFSFGLTTAQDHEESSAGESHPRALAEPDVNVSARPAPITQPTARRQLASAGINVAPAGQCVGANGWRDAGGDTVCISAAPNAPGVDRKLETSGTFPTCSTSRSRRASLRVPPETCGRCLRGSCRYGTESANCESSRGPTWQPCCSSQGKSSQRTFHGGSSRAEGERCHHVTLRAGEADPARQVVTEKGVRKQEGSLAIRAGDEARIRPGGRLCFASAVRKDAGRVRTQSSVQNRPRRCT